MKHLFFLLLCLISYAQSVNVAITVDDGWADHYQMAQDLSARGMKGVFYINSDRINSTNRLNLNQLIEIRDMGHEIGSHTLLHERLSTQTYEEQKTAICEDRNKLLSWGFNVTTFCFPFGADTPESFEILGICGFNGARDSGGIRVNTSCTRCPRADNIPPADPQQIRSVSYRLEMGVEVLKWFVLQADQDERYSNGLLSFIFHEYGDYPNKSGSITRPEFLEFLDWLKQENVPVVTIDETINTRVYPNFDLLPVISSGGETHAGKPYISFTFDDGTIDHYEVVAPLLEKYDTRGTFFVNSGHIGTPGFMNATQLLDLQSRGHEIGGHSVNQQERLSELTSETQLLRIQTDFNTLSNIGLNITSFSWPFGYTSLELIEMVKSVGYLRARDIGGIKIPSSCGLCPSTLRLPLSDSAKYAIRSFNVKSFHTFGNLMWQVFRAEDWVLNNPEEISVLPFTFHTVCKRCGYNPTRFEDFLRWLKPRYKIGTTNELIKNVI